MYKDNLKHFPGFGKPFIAFNVEAYLKYDILPSRPDNKWCSVEGVLLSYILKEL